MLFWVGFLFVFRDQNVSLMNKHLKVIIKFSIVHISFTHIEKGLPLENCVKYKMQLYEGESKVLRYLYIC